MTVIVYHKGKIAVDRMLTLERNNVKVGSRPSTKIRVFGEHSKLLLDGVKVRAIVYSGVTQEFENILTNMHDSSLDHFKSSGYDLMNFFDTVRLGLGRFSTSTYVLTDKITRLSWSSGASVARQLNGKGLLITEPQDTNLPFTTISWCKTAEEIAWLYCGFSRQCGFGVDVLDCVTGEVTYHPYPSDAVRQNVRRTLLENLDRFFVRPEPDNNVEELVYEF